MTSVETSGWVEFRFYRPGVGGSRVVGAFNGWPGLGSEPASPLTPISSIQPIQLEMSPSPDGWWTALAWLAPGEYRFHYEAGGERYADYAAHGVAWDEVGWHSILNVPERPQLLSSAEKAHPTQIRPARMVA